MIRERLRSWLGIDETERKLEELAKEVSLARENLKREINEIKKLVEELSKDKAERETVRELLFRVDELEREIKVLEKFSLPQMEIQGVSQEEQLKAKILTILSAREEITISELQSLAGVGWKKLYAALRDLEKEKQLTKIRKGRRVILKIPEK